MIRRGKYPKRPLAATAGSYSFRNLEKKTRINYESDVVIFIRKASPSQSPLSLIDADSDAARYALPDLQSCACTPGEEQARTRIRFARSRQHDRKRWFGSTARNILHARIAAWIISNRHSGCARNSGLP